MSRDKLDFIIQIHVICLKFCEKLFQDSNLFFNAVEVVVQKAVEVVVKVFYPFSNYFRWD